MPYTVAGTLKLPETGQPAAGVILKFIALQSISPVLDRSESVIVTSPTGAYSIQLEYNTYSVFATLYDNKPINCGQIVLNSTVATGLDLPTLLNGGYSEPTTPSWIVELQRLANVTTTAAQAAAASAAASSTSAAAAAASAAQASQISGLSTVAEAIGLAALPLPDVWAPLSDSLRLITGYGREVKVGEDVVARMVNFSRSTTATYIGKDGLLKTAAANEPRFEKEGLLIEGQSTNLVIRSEDMTQWPWVGTNYGTGVLPIVTGNYAVAPDGSQSATRLILNKGAGTTGADESTMRCSLNTTVGSTYTLSVWLKSTDGVSQQTVSLSFNGGDGGGALTVTGEWRRYQITTLSAIDANRTPRLQLRGGFGTSDTADILVWGWQQENLPFASSYIPTNGAAVTRASDLCWIPNALNVTPDYGDLTIEMEVRRNLAIPANVFPRAIHISDRQFVVADSTRIMARGGGIEQVTIGAAAPGTRERIAATVKGNTTACFLNGTKATLPQTPILPVSNGTSCFIGSRNGLNGLFGHVRNVRIWQRTLSDEQIKAAA